MLIISFFSGMKEGAVKSFFSLVGLIVSIPLAGLSYHLLAGVLSFLPGEDWDNFIGFLVTMGIISLILTLIFLPARKLVEQAWNKGVLFRLIGGILSLFGAAVSWVVFTLVVNAFPIFGLLEDSLAGSSVLDWLVVHLSFIQALLPESIRGAATITTAVILYHS